MLTTTNDLSSMNLSAGEPLLLEVQFRNAAGAVIDPATRAYVLSFYGAGADADKAIDGALLQDDTGRFVRFARPGTFFEASGGLVFTVELAERFSQGRYVVARGLLTVARSASGIASLDTTAIGRFVTRIVIRDAQTLGDQPTFAQSKRLYAATFGPPAPAPMLQTLTLSGTLRVGVASTGTIQGATDGSTITENLPGFSVDSARRTYAHNGTGSAGTIAEALFETLDGATNSGRASAVTIAPAGGQATLTIDPLVTRSGDTYTFTVRRSGPVVAAATRACSLAASTDYQPAAAAGDFGGTFPAAPVTFAAGAATASVAFTVPATVQPE